MQLVEGIQDAVAVGDIIQIFWCAEFHEPGFLIPVSVKKVTPLDKETRGKVSSRHIESGCGFMLLLPDRTAKAGVQGACFFKDTGMIQGKSR